MGGHDKNREVSAVTGRSKLRMPGGVTGEEYFKDLDGLIKTVLPEIVMSNHAAVQKW